jgi:energy-coupling factor transport system ATP-binding protein
VVIEHRVSVWRDLVDRVIVLAPGGGVLADGSPERVLRERGAELSAAGVWVPEFPPPVAVRRGGPAGDRLLDADGLSIARVRGTRVGTDIGLSLHAGRATALLGPNGVGKSTLALTLAGLLKPEAGAVVATPTLRSGLQQSAPIAWKSRELLTRIGTVFQDPEHQFLTATVRDELAVGPRALKMSAADIDARVDELLVRLRLDSIALANPFTLSGGEKRRLSVATVLATRPRLLVLDEPTFGQDSRTWSELVALLAELLDGGRSVLAVTHDEQFVAALADHELRLLSPLEAAGASRVEHRIIDRAGRP